MHMLSLSSTANSKFNCSELYKHYGRKCFIITASQAPICARKRKRVVEIFSMMLKTNELIEVIGSTSSRGRQSSVSVAWFKVQQKVQLKSMLQKQANGKRQCVVARKGLHAAPTIVFMF